MITITYELWNDDETDAGETTRRGYVWPCGGVDDKPAHVPFRDMLRLINYVEHVEETYSGATLYCTPERDMQTWEQEVRAVHVKATPASIARIKKALRALRFYKS